MASVGFGVGRKGSFIGSAAHQATARDVAAQFKVIEERYAQVINNLLVDLPEAMIVALEPTFEKSKYYCPVDTGRMIDSGYLEVVARGNSPRVEMGYGRGGQPPYTAFVHENTDMYHEEPTRAKWLQAALEEDESELLDRIRRGLRLYD